MDGTAHWVIFDTTTYREIQPGFDDYAWECAKCGVLWQFTDGGPAENKMRYCPKCGRYITDVVRMEDGGDE